MIENLTRRDVGKLVGAGAVVASNVVTTGAIDAAAQERDARGQSTCLGQFGESDGTAPDSAMQRADELLREMTVEEKSMPPRSSMSPGARA